MLTRTRRLSAAAAALLVLPAAMAPSRCGFATDFTETFLLTEPVERLVIVTDDGNIDAVAYRRPAVLMKRHTFGFLRDLGEPDYTLADGVARFESRCEVPNNCMFDHMLELPFGVELDVTLSEAFIDLGYTDADVVADFVTGWFRGVRLAAPNLTITVDETADVDLDYAVAPASVSVDIRDGAVAIAVPAGTYRCALTAADGAVDVDGVTCDDAAPAVLEVRVGAGDITITEAAP